MVRMPPLQALTSTNHKETPAMKTLILAFAVLGAAPALAQNALTTT